MSWNPEKVTTCSPTKPIFLCCHNIISTFSYYYNFWTRQTVWSFAGEKERYESCSQPYKCFWEVRTSLNEIFVAFTCTDFHSMPKKKQDGLYKFIGYSVSCKRFFSVIFYSEFISFNVQKSVNNHCKIIWCFNHQSIINRS